MLITPLVLLIDQATKVAVRLHVPEGQRLPIIPHLFDLVHAENHGAAFSLLEDFELRLLLFSVVTLVAFSVIVTVYRHLRRDQVLEALALGAVFGGSLGNFVDRLIYRSVTDFLEFYLVDGAGRFFVRHFGNNRWPAFNVADVAILGGVLVFIARSYVVEVRARRAAAAT